MGILENFVAPFINDAMGKYFSNFDATKLDIGTGSVVLKEMLVRPELMEDFGVPLKLVFGKVGTVTISFGIMSFANPWSNTREVGVDLKDVYILVAPATSVPYKGPDNSKKQRELEAAVEHDPQLNPNATAKGESDPGMVIGIVNNIKINVENIHIRYEDETTHANSPFAFGITLKKLSAISTDDVWQPTSTAISAETFYKLVTLDELGFYWNSKMAQLLLSITPNDEPGAIGKMQEMVADNHELHFILGPLTANAKVTVTMRPNKLASPFSKPMADCVLCLERIDMNLTNEQFRDVLVLMESFEDMARKQPYLEYRPFQVPYKENPKAWWKYAYTCISSGIKQRNRLYDPNYLVKQKKKCDTYEMTYADYRQKVNLKTASEEDKLALQKLEDSISNQDILIIRKRVSFKDETIKEKQMYWSWGMRYYASLSPDKLKEVLAEKLSPEEMKQLEEYVNLEPQPPITEFPAGYAQIVFDFALPKLTLNIAQIQPKAVKLPVFQFWVQEFCTKAKVFPAEKGLWAEVRLGDIGATGVETDGEAPSILKSDTTQKEPFTIVSFSKNPANSRPGQHISVKVERIEVVYDSPTIQKVIDCFAWPKGVELKKASAAVTVAVDTAKNQSVNNLKEAIADTQELYLDININAPYFLFPSGGCLKTADTIAIINAGGLVLRTIPRERSVTDSSAIESVGNTDGDVSAEIMHLTYNQYVLTFKDSEFFVALKGEDIMAAIDHTFPPDPRPGMYHSNRPASLFKAAAMDINLNQCIISEDTRFPKFKIEIVIPLFDFQISDLRVLKLIRLVLSTPIPVMPTAPPSAFIDGHEDSSFQPVTEVLSVEPGQKEDKDADEDPAAYDPEKATQYSLLIFSAVIREVSFLLFQIDDSNNSIQPLLDVHLLNFDVHAKIRTFGITIDASMDQATVTYLNATAPEVEPDSPLYLLYTPEAKSGTQLLKFHFFSVSEACPKSRVGAIRQKAEIEARSIELNFHQQSLEKIVRLTDRVADEVAKYAKPAAPEVKVVKKKLPTENEDSKKGFSMAKILKIKDLPNAGEVLLKATFLISNFSISLTSETKNIGKFLIGQVVGSFEDRPFKSKISAQITHLLMLNLDKPTIYTKIMETDPIKNFANAGITLYKTQVNPTDANIKVKFTMECAPLILVGDYAGNILEFFIHLQNAREAFKTARAATRKAAAVAVKDSYETDQKLWLNIGITAPKLIIVKDALSPEAVVINFGRLDLKNVISAVDTQIGKPAILDTAKITLAGISISRAVMDKTTGTIKTSLYILEPTQITLDLQRNLSPWYPALPGINLTGELDVTIVKISSLDVEVAAHCVLGYTKRLQKAHKAVKAADRAESHTSLTEEVAPPPPPATEENEVNEKVAEAVHKQTVGANIKIDQIGFHLYQKSTSLEDTTGIVPRDAAGSLAEFYLQTVSLDFKQWSNDDMQAALILVEMLLRDSRPNCGEITDFVTKKENANNVPLLDLKFAKSQVEDLPLFDVQLIGQGIEIILYVEFMKLCMDFALATAKGIPKDEASLTIEDSDSFKLDKTKKDSGKKLLLLGGSAPDDSATPAKKPTVIPLVKASIDLHQTEILLLETLKSNDTNSLAVYGDSCFKVDSEKVKGIFGGGQWNLGVMTCKYTPDKPREKICHVLEPVVIKIGGNWSQTQGTFADIELADSLIHVNAGTILFLSKIAKQFQKVAEDFKASQGEEEVESIDYSEVWNPRENYDQGYWFLNTTALSQTVNRLKGASSPTLISDVAETKKLIEKATIKVGRGVVILEAGIGSNPTPMLLFEGFIDAEVRDWSTGLVATGSLGGCVYYNNVIKGSWEYLVETNEVHDAKNFGEPKREPWQLKFEVIIKPKVADKSPIVVTILSENLLEVTVSKTSIDLLKALGENFANSLKGEGTEGDVNNPPYVFLNDVGTDIQLELDKSQTALTLERAIDEDADGCIIVKAGQQIDIGMELDDVRASPSDHKKRSLIITIPEFENFSRTISVRRNGKTCYKVKDSQKRSLAIVIDIKAQQNFSTLVSVRGVVEVHSEMSALVDVFATVPSSEEVSVGLLKPYSSINLPISVLYGDVHKVKVSYATPGFKKSAPTNGVSSLTNLRTTSTDTATTKPESSGPDGVIRIFGFGEKIPAEDYGKPTNELIYKLVLRPPLIINNFCNLPVDVSADNVTFQTVPAGSPLDLLTARPDRGDLYLKIKNFQELEWTAHLRFVSVEANKFNSIEFKATGSIHKLYFKFRPNVASDGKLEEISFFCPYWMVNRTGETLIYQGTKSYGSSFVHPPDHQGPLMKAYDVDGKEFAKFKIADSDWSPAISLETPITDAFACKGKERDYEVTVSVTLSTFTMTKIATFLPKYTVSNNCAFSIVLLQSGKRKEEKIIPPKSTVAFWPARRQAEPIDLQVKVLGTEEFTSAFRFAGTKVFLLKLNNSHGGLCANVNVLEDTGTLTITEFDISHVPVLLVNDTNDIDIGYSQGAAGLKRSIPPRKSVIYSWDLGSEAFEIHWTLPGLENVPGTPTPFKMDKETAGEFKVTKEGKTKSYAWATFLSGFRSVFLITEDLTLIPLIQAYLKMGTPKSDDSGINSNDGPMTLELNLGLDGLGLSLVDDQALKDIIYVRLEGTPCMWEGAPIASVLRYTTQSPQDTIALENGYLDYTSGKMTKNPLLLTNKMKVDYSNYKMSAPKAVQLRRHQHRPGIGARLRLFEYCKELSLTIPKLQIDNQLQHAEHVHILSLVPIHHSVTTKTQIPPPLVLLNYKEWSQGSQAKTLSASICLQEFQLSVDYPLVNNILQVFSVPPGAATAEHMATMYNKDVEITSVPNDDFFKTQGAKSLAATVSTLYQLLQIHKLQFQISAKVNPKPDGNYFENLLLGLGATIISFSDVSISLDGLEIKKKRLTGAELQDIAIQHYKSEFLRELPKFVLGMDILGNPTKLLGGLTIGLTKLVTEPINGAMEGNLIEGISSGAEAAIGGTIGGLTTGLASATNQLDKLITGIGIPILPNVFGLLTGGLNTIGGAVGAGSDKDAATNLRPRRVLLLDIPLKPYSHYTTIGHIVYTQAVTNRAAAGDYLGHYVHVDATGNWQILLVLEKEIKYITSTPKLSSMTTNWSKSWTELDDISKTDKEIVFKEPQNLFGSVFSIGTVGLVKTGQHSVSFNDKSQTECAFKQCQTAWKIAKKQPKKR